MRAQEQNVHGVHTFYSQCSHEEGIYSLMVVHRHERSGSPGHRSLFKDNLIKEYFLVHESVYLPTSPSCSFTVWSAGTDSFIHSHWQAQSEWNSSCLPNEERMKDQEEHTYTSRTYTVGPHKVRERDQGRQYVLQRWMCVHDLRFTRRSLAIFDGEPSQVMNIFLLKSPTADPYVDLRS